MYLDPRPPNASRISPFLKWVGGKRQLLPHLLHFLPHDVLRGCYYEPFIGGGALLFALRPSSAVINDANAELINAYRVVKTHPEEVIGLLRRYVNTEECFYRVRALDRQPGYRRLDPIVRASRFIYLNKTCYNGLYRVNRAGEYNVPFGRYKVPHIFQEEQILAVSSYLRQARVEILSGDYAEALRGVTREDFVYLDPPYHPLSASANFTSYVSGGWGERDQLRLKLECDRLNALGVRFMLSNSCTPFILELYRGYVVVKVSAKRSINSNGRGRGPVDEVLIRNYE